MRARIYLSVQGESFKPADFYANAGGQVRRRKHSGSPLTNIPLEYWMSAEVLGDTTEIDALLSKLLAEFVPLLADVARVQGLLVLAHVVIEFCEGEEPSGLHLSNSTIHMLGQIGAALDVDAVPLIPTRS